MNKHKKRFLWTLAGQFLIVLWMGKTYYDYKQHAAYLWWHGAFMDPVGHLLYLEFGLAMCFLGTIVIAYMNWYRWKIDPNKRF